MKRTQAEKNFRNMMILYALLFYLVGAGFYFEHVGILSGLNHFGNWFGYEPLAAPQQKFWVIMAASLMAAGGTCALMASLRVPRTRHFVIPLLVGLLASSGLSLLEYVRGNPRGFPYLALFLVDSSLFLIAFYYYTRALLSSSGVVRESPAQPAPSVEEPDEEPGEAQ